MKKLRHTPALTKTLLLCLGLLGCALSAPAQRPFQYLYGIEQGLPIAEPDVVFFSRKGELWCTYPMGEHISRFDGVTWTHSKATELGFPGGLWFMGENRHGIWWRATGSVQPARLALLTPQGTWKAYPFQRRETILWDNATGEPVFIDSLFTVHRYNVQTDTFLPAGLLYPDPQPGGSYAIGSDPYGTPFVIINRNSEKYLVLFGAGFQHRQELPHPFAFTPLLLQPGRVEGFIFKRGAFLWFENGRVRPIRITLPNGRAGEILDYAKLRPWNGQEMNTGLIVKAPSSDVQYLYALEGIDSARLLLSHIPADAFNRFSQDPEGNWWVGTSSGLLRSDRHLLTFRTNDPDMAPALHAIGEDAEGRIWLGGYGSSGGFSVFDGALLRRAPFDRVPIPVLPGSGTHIGGTLYFFTERFPGIAAIRNSKLRWQEFPEHQGKGNNLSGYCILPLANGQVALGLTYWGLGIAQQKQGSLFNLRLIGQDKGMLLSNVLTIAEDKNRRLWLGRLSQGLALYDPQRDTAVTWLRSPEHPERIGVISLLNDPQGTLWIGANNGFYKLPEAHRLDYLKEDIFKQIEKVALPGGDTTIVSLLANTGAYIVAGSQLAVHFIEKQYRGPRPRIFTLRYGRDIAGGSSEQNAVLLDSKGYLWIGAQEGVTRIDLQNLRFDTSATTLRLTEFQAGDAFVPINEAHGEIGRIPGRKRNFAFTFTPTGNTFLKDDLYFDIALVNRQGDTLYQRRGVVDKIHEIDYVPFGRYTLHITAYKHNVVSGEALYRFKVPRNMDESPWFWLGMAAFGLSIPFLGYRQRQRERALLLQQRADAEKAKREQDALRLQALSNFFNPHFINNALHWVQSRYRKDPETTLVIGKLADNVEALYMNTQNGKFFHSLAQELKIVQNYLAIQQVRFGEKLHVRLELPSPADVPCMPVPALLLQIHTENAVEKGIRNREGAGQFLLRVRRLESGCEIVIEDDGRGRPGQTALYTERKGSTAVMDELIQLLNAYNPEPLSVRYEDFIYGTPDAGQYGTRVVLFIPKSYSYEFYEMASPGH